MYKHTDTIGYWFFLRKIYESISNDYSKVFQDRWPKESIKMREGESREMIPIGPNEKDRGLDKLLSWNELDDHGHPNALKYVVCLIWSWWSWPSKCLKLRILFDLNLMIMPI